MHLDERASQIGVRVDAAFRAEIKAAADRHFGGNESYLVRAATELYIRLRQRLGLQFEPVVGSLVPPDGDDRRAA